MCESATYLEYSQNIFPPQGVVINLNVSFSRRHRSEGLGEAGATAAHLSGPKLHQQVRHTQSYTFTHAQKHPSTEGTIVPPVKLTCVWVCVYVACGEHLQWLTFPIPTAVTHPQTSTENHTRQSLLTPCAARGLRHVCVCVWWTDVSRPTKCLVKSLQDVTLREIMVEWKREVCFLW